MREDGKELCPSTPCEVVLKSDGTDATKTHKLVISRNGFKAETRVVKPTDPPMHVKLSHAGGSVRPHTTSQATAKPDTTTPSGFKEAPY